MGERWVKNVFFQKLSWINWGVQTSDIGPFGARFEPFLAPLLHQSSTTCPDSELCREGGGVGGGHFPKIIPLALGGQVVGK